MYSSCAIINNTPYFFILLSVKKIFLSLTFHLSSFFSPSHVLVCLLDSSLSLLSFFADASPFFSFFFIHLSSFLSFSFFFFLFSPVLSFCFLSLLYFFFSVSLVVVINFGCGFVEDFGYGGGGDWFWLWLSFVSLDGGLVVVINFAILGVGFLIFGFGSGGGLWLWWWVVVVSCELFYIILIKMVKNRTMLSAT